MFITYCQHCESDENSGYVTIDKELTSESVNNPNSSISGSIKTVLECQKCDISEEVRTGILPSSKSKNFSSKKQTESASLDVEINDQKISYISIDDTKSEDFHYTQDGIRGHSKIHHIHVHARNPPTLSKTIHHVRIGDFVNKDMKLGSVRYHDSDNRTLKFYDVLNSSGSISESD